MRILHVNDYREAGGAEVMVHSAIRGLRERGHEVELFTGDDVPGRRTPLSYIDSRAARASLRRRLDSFTPDVVHLHNFYHVLSPGILQTLREWRIVRRTGHPPVRVVMTAHDFHLICPNSGMTCFESGIPRPAQPDRLRSMAHLAARRWDGRGVAHSSLKLVQHVWNYRLHDRMRAIDRILCPSRFLQHLLAHRGLPATHLPHPAPGRCCGQPDGSTIGTRGNDRLGIVFAGRIEPEKGLREFLAAIPSSFAGSTTIVGEGSQRGAIEQMVRDGKMEDRVRFTGRLSRSETLREIAKNHVLVLPSLCFESYGLVLIEALSVGTNLLAADQPALREIVEEGGEGFLFDPRSPESIASVITEIEREFVRGRLNAFDVQPFLEGRSEEAYLNGLLAAYGCA